MNISYLLIGGNEGDREAWLENARENIAEAAGPVLLRSSLYETAAWGKTDQADFLNQALQIGTSLDALALMDTLLKIEEKMGRRRVEKWGARRIDIDILFFNEEIIRLPQLVVPHPEIQNRRFALAPMEEIAPLYIHPLLRKSIRVLLAECPDKLDVKKISSII
ncbi:MAG TPA: 2-amino-4-hydroxy-6-hydroxymethyldihydropteridine diphosphokinase [Puia sp.]|nr:2-amino-4-hydroxy-6-hydroxymethyldihydropteridine diphosphokinase [Puia sp.]